jgi:hypothetical protein
MKSPFLYQNPVNHLKDLVDLTLHLQNPKRLKSKTMTEEAINQLDVMEDSSKKKSINFLTINHRSYLPVTKDIDRQGRPQREDWGDQSPPPKIKISEGVQVE